MILGVGFVVLFLILLANATMFSSVLNAQQLSVDRLNLRLVGFSAEQEGRLLQAVFRAYDRTNDCQVLANRQPELKRRVQQIYNHTTIVISHQGTSNENPYDCGSTHSGVFSGGALKLTDLAFDEDVCGPLPSTVFHEVLHMGTPFGDTFWDVVGGTNEEERRVTELEHDCFPEYFRRRRGFYARQLQSPNP
jgi:Na+-transporting methylmalonyl-CoA/oxaloacetate decarboxylase gamma subunit